MRKKHPQKESASKCPTGSRVVWGPGVGNSEINFVDFLRAVFFPLELPLGCEIDDLQCGKLPRKCWELHRKARWIRSSLGRNGGISCGQRLAIK